MNLKKNVHKQLLFGLLWFAHSRPYITSMHEWVIHKGNKPGVAGQNKQQVVIFGDVHMQAEQSVDHYQWLCSLLEQFHQNQLPLSLFLEDRQWDQVTTHLVNNTLPDLILFVRNHKNRFRHLRYVPADLRQKNLFWSAQFCIDLMQLIADQNYQWPLSSWLKLDSLEQELASLYGASPTIEALQTEIEQSHEQLKQFDAHVHTFFTFKKRLSRLEKAWKSISATLYPNTTFTIAEYFKTWLLGRKKKTFTSGEFRHIRQFLKLDSYIVESYFLQQQIEHPDSPDTIVWLVGQKHANALNQLLHDYQKNRWATSVQTVGRTKRIREMKDARPLSLERLNTLAMFKEPSTESPKPVRSRMNKKLKAL